VEVRVSSRNRQVRVGYAVYINTGRKNAGLIHFLRYWVLYSWIGDARSVCRKINL